LVLDAPAAPGAPSVLARRQSMRGGKGPVGSRSATALRSTSHPTRRMTMCRSIQRLRPAKGSDTPPATREEIEAAARQFVRKVSGFSKPASHNQDVFEGAVEEITVSTERLLASLSLR